MKTRLSVILLGAALAAGCSTMQAPEVKVGAVKLADKTDQGARVEVTLVLSNPNDVALPLVRSDYTITVGGQPFSFDDDAQRVLPAGGSQTLIVPAAFAGPGEKFIGADYSVSGAVEYDPPTAFRKILNEMDWPLPSVDFSAAGKLGP